MLLLRGGAALSAEALLEEAVRARGLERLRGLLRWLKPRGAEGAEDTEGAGGGAEGGGGSGGGGGGGIGGMVEPLPN